jgi:hypothetical protein
VANVFISYARRDRDRVLALASALEGEGLSVWWDPNLVPGKRFRDIIAAELEAADSVVVVWTAASIQSDYVQDEAEEARIRGVLVPITLEPVKPPAGFRQVQAADLSQWTGAAQHPEFRMLLTAVRTLVAAARAAEAGGRANPPDEDRRAPASAAAASAAPSPAAPQTSAPPTSAHPEALLVPRLFDVFARPPVWLTAAGFTVASGKAVGFGLSGAAAAMLLWAGAMAQACVHAGIGPGRKTMVMVIAVGVGLIVGAGAHSLSGTITAILVGAVVFAGSAMSALATRRGSGAPGATRDPALRSAYQAYGADIQREVLENLRRRRRRYRPKSDRDG